MRVLVSFGFLCCSVALHACCLASCLLWAAPPPPTAAPCCACHPPCRYGNAAEKPSDDILALQVTGCWCWLRGQGALAAGSGQGQPAPWWAGWSALGRGPVGASPRLRTQACAEQAVHFFPRLLAPGLPASLVKHSRHVSPPRCSLRAPHPGHRGVCGVRCCGARGARPGGQGQVAVRALAGARRQRPLRRRPERPLPRAGSACVPPPLRLQLPPGAPPGIGLLRGRRGAQGPRCPLGSPTSAHQPASKAAPCTLPLCSL